jgi:hypothetical protein
MADDDIFTFGDWGTLLNSKGETVNRIGQSATVRATERIRPSGKSRVTIDAVGTPFMVDLGEHIGKTVSEGITESVHHQHNQVTEIASAGTRLARGRAAKAFDRGEPWTKREYGGGRIGPMRPDSSERKGIDSGRLRKSFVMGYAPRTGEYVGNVAANRLTPEFLARHPEFLAWYVTNVIQPALQGERVFKAVAKAVGETVVKVRDAGAEARRRLVANARAALDAGRGLGGELEQLGAEPDEP